MDLIRINNTGNYSEIKSLSSNHFLLIIYSCWDTRIQTFTRWVTAMYFCPVCARKKTSVKVLNISKTLGSGHVWGQPHTRPRCIIALPPPPTWFVTYKGNMSEVAQCTITEQSSLPWKVSMCPFVLNYYLYTLVEPVGFLFEDLKISSDW